MEKKKSNHKKYKFTYIKATAGTLFLCLFFLKGYTPYEETGENFFHIQVNGRDVGTLGDKERIDELLLQARKNVVADSDELVFMTADMVVVGEQVLWGKVDTEEDVLNRMEETLRASIRETLHRSYTLKIDEYIINLSSMEDVQTLLLAAIDKYGNDGKFAVEIRNDGDREFGVLTADVVATSALEDEGWQSNTEAGVQNLIAGIQGEQIQEQREDFEDFELGIRTMNFADSVEIVESYLPESQLTDLEQAIGLVIMEQETPSVYEVVAGDTLSEIAIKVNIPMDTIVEMNDQLEDVTSTLQIGDELLITVPEPELSVARVEEEYYEEIYDADIVYIENDNWYTNQTVVHQQPSAGFRKVVADVSYLNDKEISREILKEEIVMEAVPKIVERGTKIPPTYVRPISGGVQTSGFGRRSAPTKGASSYHKGIDWATPTGTPVYASCGGTVVKAGWGSGYGYVVYINHEDGRQTRYGHLSKVLVSEGQSVKQGDRIALSGSTGISTGPHLHFEILINGTQVNPLDYLNR
ncbi:M23 family metallopeptidase [Acetatifactor aquisgranensis]|uniref:M23 family metallopeptidase n=1 Tax=Acetatifactor aquisgranensis TaxID=2941233 RepID=UPI002040B86E|nr:M23 family metallopeptidase [Acetatifactor aquisgranensis]MCI8543010.1 M23 family metallopeptidase [Lachnospiraceae bacterium]